MKIIGFPLLVFRFLVLLPRSASSFCFLGSASSFCFLVFCVQSGAALHCARPAAHAGGMGGRNKAGLLQLVERAMRVLDHVAAARR
jgi:hypothetical protein